MWEFTLMQNWLSYMQYQKHIYHTNGGKLFGIVSLQYKLFSL